MNEERDAKDNHYPFAVDAIAVVIVGVSVTASLFALACVT